jgi:CheY-like chemotaxis protein
VPVRQQWPLPAGHAALFELGRGPRTLRILMVDDHVDTSKVLAMLLLRKGYTAEVRHTIADALEFAKSNDFDVLVSDIGLPDGTGLELIAKLRKLKGHYTFRAIAMTGYGTEQDIHRGVIHARRDRARNVTVADELDTATDFAHFFNQLIVAGAVENTDSDIFNILIERAPGARVAPAQVGMPRASALLWLAESAPEMGRVEDAAGWEPEYVRASGAERIAAEGRLPEVRP